MQRVWQGGETEHYYATHWSKSHVWTLHSMQSLWENPEHAKCFGSACSQVSQTICNFGSINANLFQIWNLLMMQLIWIYLKWKESMRVNARKGLPPVLCRSGCDNSLKQPTNHKLTFFTSADFFCSKPDNFHALTQALLFHLHSCKMLFMLQVICHCAVYLLWKVTF